MIFILNMVTGVALTLPLDTKKLSKLLYLRIKYKRERKEILFEFLVNTWGFWGTLSSKKWFSETLCMSLISFSIHITKHILLNLQRTCNFSKNTCVVNYFENQHLFW